MNNLLLIAGALGLVIGWFLGQLRYKRKLNSLKNESKLKLNKNNDRWETKVEKIVSEYSTKIDKEKSSTERRIKELTDKNESQKKDMDSIKTKLLITKEEKKNVEKRLKDEYQEEIKKHKNRASTLLNEIDIDNNKDLDNLIESLVTLEGNAIKEEAELRYKLKDTQYRLENKISNLNREIMELKSEIENLKEEKKIGIDIGFYS
jgi:uncharacterized membrane-anchored protein YhcB (DUF1043 family)